MTSYPVCRRVSNPIPRKGTELLEIVDVRRRSPLLVFSPLSWFKLRSPLVRQI
ncbi:hypothetical protein H6F95_27645 [Cyanobacteria bacterium FACHB-471]|nr:hypothetical protein [Cyanobacteria bacterium FACHB-471]